MAFGMGITKVFGQNGKLLPGAGDHINKLSGGGSQVPQQQAQAPVQGNAQKAAAAPKATPKPQAYSAYAPQAQTPQPQMSTTYAQPGGGWGHQAQPPQGGPNMPGVINPMYSQAPAFYPGANTQTQQVPQQTYGDPRGNYANMPDGQRPPAFQESAQTPFGTMSPQDFYAQREQFVQNINNQHALNAQNAGIFGAADLPQNSAPDWSNMASMWPQQDGMAYTFGGMQSSDPYGTQIRQLMGGPDPINPQYVNNGTRGHQPNMPILIAPGSSGPNPGYNPGGQPTSDPYGIQAAQQAYIKQQAEAKANNAKINATIRQRPAAMPTSNPEVDRASRIANAQMKYGRPLTRAEVSQAKSGPALASPKPTPAQTKAKQKALASILGYTPGNPDDPMFDGILKSPTGVSQQKKFGLNPN